MPSPASLAIHLDLVGGVSGDMFVAALVDALPALAAPILAELAAVRSAGEEAPAFAETSSGGLRARRFGLATALARHCLSPSIDGRDQRRRRIVAHEHAGTTYAALRRRLERRAAFRADARARARAARASRRCGSAACTAFPSTTCTSTSSRTGIRCSTSSRRDASRPRFRARAGRPLRCRSAAARCAPRMGCCRFPHRRRACCSTGYPWHDDGIRGERVTPTGAAILRHLVPAAHCSGRRDAGRLIGTGSGAGTRSSPGTAEHRARIRARTRPGRQ